MTNPCTVCARDTEKKAKPGIFPCAGCKQMFCTQHVAFHRQELTNELDLIIGERNELQDFFDNRQNLPDTSVHMNIIDEWLKKTVEQIHQIAENARQRLINIGKEQRTNIKDEILVFSKELNDMRENESYFEQDLENMKSKCNHLKTILSQVNTNINTTDIYNSLDQVITFKQVEREAKQINIKGLSFVESIMKNQNLYKQIKLPHDGKLYCENRFVLIKNNTNGYTIVNFEDNSMKSLSLRNFDAQVHYWSSPSATFFYPTECCIEILQITPISGQVGKEEMTIATEGKIVNIAYFNNTILTVTDHKVNKIVIEEWDAIGLSRVERNLSTNLLSRWRPPLSCLTDESIMKIDFDQKHIVLAINNSKKSPKNRLEFRTRGMLVVRYIVLDEDVDFISLSLSSMKDGWLLSRKKNQDQLRLYTFIDKDLHEHEQNILSNQDIESIAVIHPFYGAQVLAVYRKRNNVQLSTNVNQTLILDLYKIPK